MIEEGLTGISTGLNNILGSVQNLTQNLQTSASRASDVQQLQGFISLFIGQLQSDIQSKVAALNGAVAQIQEDYKNEKDERDKQIDDTNQIINQPNNTDASAEAPVGTIAMISRKCLRKMSVRERDGLYDFWFKSK